MSKAALASRRVYKGSDFRGQGFGLGGFRVQGFGFRALAVRSSGFEVQAFGLISLVG